MALSLKKEHVKRYKDVARLFIKYGRSDLVQGTELVAVDAAEAKVPEDAEALARELASDLEALGPTFIKLGQLLSTRPDLLPPPFVEALSRLQDRVEPFDFAEVEATLSAELGARLSKLFAEFEPRPLAAASLGQVHRARLRSGRTVAVKVQRPHIRERIVEDLEALAEMADMLDAHTEIGKRYGFAGMLEEFRKTLLRELDYRQEARNLARLRENLASFDRIVVPAAVDDYTTARVLTIDYVRGQKITALHPVVRTEIDGSALADQLFAAYLKQVLVDGFVHADPHPGNVLLTEDNRIALLDLGMVFHIGPTLQEALLKLLLAVSDGRSEEAARLAQSLGQRREDFDETAFRRRVGELVTDNQDARVGDIQVGRVILMVARACGQSGLRVPPELSLLGKTLLNLDQVGQALDPEFDPNAAIRRHAAALTSERLTRSLKPGNVLASLMEFKDFAQRLPERVNRILDNVAQNELKVHVDAIDEKMLMEGFQKVANRITTGLVLAALIVGAAMLMRVETSFRILGYPGLAMLLFLVAAGAGLTLLVNIFLSDERREKKR
jgi:ubiquinone biosynthesis protein